MTPAVGRILQGDPRAIARAATWLEDRDPRGAALLRELFPHTGRAAVLGLTGPPGAGKSTLADQMLAVLRAEGKRAAVLAVDPTSPFSGGAILGDRIRMLRHHADPGVFVRSMATRGQTGGIAAATADVALLLDGAGFDTVLIETVGVGQDEVDIARVAGCTMLVLVPGLGDDVQAMKAGIMEVAGVFLINKADLPGADKLEREVRSALAAAGPEAPLPAIVRTVASEGRGVPEALQAARAFLASSRSRSRAVDAWAWRLRCMLEERLMEPYAWEAFRRAAADVVARRLDPFTAVETLLQAGVRQNKETGREP